MSSINSNDTIRAAACARIRVGTGLRVLDNRGSSVYLSVFKIHDVDQSYERRRFDCIVHRSSSPADSPYRQGRVVSVMAVQVVGIYSRKDMYADAVRKAKAHASQMLCAKKKIGVKKSPPVMSSVMSSVMVDKSNIAMTNVIKSHIGLVRDAMKSTHKQGPRADGIIRSIQPTVVEVNGKKFLSMILDTKINIA
jgi:hypothetical protein